MKFAENSGYKVVITHDFSKPYPQYVGQPQTVWQFD